MRRILALVAVGACSAAPPQIVAPSDPALDVVDVFGSRQLDRAAVLARWGKELTQLAGDAGPEVAARRDALEGQLRAVPGIAYAEISIITELAPRRAFVTVDLVDEADRARRMAFAPAPTGHHADPGGLIALWDQYEATVLTLMAGGQLSPATTRCPFWHCLSFDHASLAPYERDFAERVPAAAAELAAILREDADEERRGAAAYLLAHLSSGPQVVALAASAIRDPSDYVRNCAMRVLAQIALRHPELEIPVAPVIAALSFPAATDRNKALLILDGVTRHADARTRAAIDAAAGDVLRQLAAMRWPAIAGPARSILGRVAGPARTGAR